MPRYCIIKGGTARNVIEASHGIANAIAAETNSTAVLSDAANIGDAWDGSSFAPGASQEPVPDQVTRYQFIEAAEDILGATQDTIDAAIAAMAAGRPKRRLRAWWTGSFVLRRRGARMGELQALMGWTNNQVRQAFQAAAAAAD